MTYTLSHDTVMRRHAEILALAHGKLATLEEELLAIIIIEVTHKFQF